MASYGPQQQNNVQVVIMDDQNKSLQELFSAPFLDPSQQKQVPLYQRNLPKSFFVQPNDNQRSDKCIPPCKEISGNYQPSKNALHIHHSKAHSSPACLDASYLNNPQLFGDSQSPQSYDIKLEEGYQKLSPHQKKIYNQQFPTSKYPSSRDQLQKPKDSNRRHQHPPSAFGTPQSAQLANQMKFQICELPPFYEAAVNDENRVYFLNHQTQNTSWFDPRIPENFQKWGMTVEELEQRHYAYYKFLLERQQSDPERHFNHQMHARSFSQPTPMQGVGNANAPVGPVPGVCSPGPLSSLSSSSSLTGGQPGAPPITQVLESLHLTGPQHSHQGSIDSGVGQSVTGQTPEHALQIYEQGGIPTEFMEGVNYGGNETPFSDINILEEFDISDLNTA